MSQAAKEPQQDGTSQHYSHKMAINTHYIHERTIVLYSHSKEKNQKNIEKKSFEKKSKCHILYFF